MILRALPFSTLLRAARWQLNVPLLTGTLMVAALLAAALAAPLLAPRDPYESVTLFNGNQLLRAPYQPGTAGMLLGSDRERRDVLSRLLYGTRYTLLFVAVGTGARLLIGTTLGCVAAWYGRMARVVDVLAGAWSAIPSLFLAIIILGVVGRQVTLGQSLLVFVVVLSITGWAEIAVRTRLAVQALQHAPFVEAAYALGRGRLAVLWRHVLPNLRGLMLVEASSTLAAVLLLVAELGFLGFVVGGGQIDRGIGETPFVVSLQAEWGAMLADAVRSRREGPAYFLTMVGAFTFAILSFNLVAEGLRRRVR